MSCRNGPGTEWRRDKGVKKPPKGANAGNGWLGVAGMKEPSRSFIRLNTTAPRPSPVYVAGSDVSLTAKTYLDLQPAQHIIAQLKAQSPSPSVTGMLDEPRVL